MKDNFVRLVGFLGNKPELITLNNDKKVCKISIATNRNWKDSTGEWQKNTTWHKVTMWDKRAELASQNLDIGDRVEVWGEIVYSEWEDKEGKAHRDAEVRGDGFLNIIKPVKEETEELY